VGLSTVLLLIAGAAVSIQTQQTPQKTGWGVEEGTKREAQTGQRRASRERGRKIKDYLRPSDESLEIVDDQPQGLVPPSPPVGDPDNAKEPLQMLAERRPIVLMVKVVSTRGQLAKTEDALETLVQGEVVEVIKSPRPGMYHYGDAVEIVSAGGELVIGRTTVRANLRGMNQPWRIGETYVVFLNEASGHTFTAATGEWLWVNGPSLQPMLEEDSFFGKDSFDKDETINSLRFYSLSRRGGQ
jgi:hypothetical protein